MPVFVVGQVLPDVTGLLYDDAVASLATVYAVPSLLDPIVSLSVGYNRVISQVPVAGTAVTDVLTVQLLLSSGDGSNWGVKVYRQIGV